MAGMVVWMVAVTVAMVVADDLEEFDRMMAEPQDRWGLVEGLVVHLAFQGGLGGPPGHGAGPAWRRGLRSPAWTMQVPGKSKF